MADKEHFLRCTRECHKRGAIRADCARQNRTALSTSGKSLCTKTIGNDWLTPAAYSFSPCLVEGTALSILRSSALGNVRCTQKWHGAKHCSPPSLTRARQKNAEIGFENAFWKSCHFLPMWLTHIMRSLFACNANSRKRIHQLSTFETEH
jgi:hypothetical protein